MGFIHKWCPSTDNALSLHDQQYNAFSHPTCNVERPTVATNLLISMRSWLGYFLNNTHIRFIITPAYDDPKRYSSIQLCTCTRHGTPK